MVLYVWCSTCGWSCPDPPGPLEGVPRSVSAILSRFWKPATARRPKRAVMDGNPRLMVMLLADGGRKRPCKKGSDGLAPEVGQLGQHAGADQGRTAFLLDYRSEPVRPPVQSQRATASWPFGILFSRVSRPDRRHYVGPVRASSRDEY